MTTAPPKTQSEIAAKDRRVGFKAIREQSRVDHNRAFKRAVTKKSAAAGGSAATAELWVHFAHH